MDTHPFYLIAVHGGAGSHSRSKARKAEMKNALKLACRAAITRLSAREVALDAAEHAIMVLEDDATLNAGYGSNLTLDGTVECDASIMDGRTGHSGSVGATSGVKNPICAAKAVLRHASNPDPLGRVPPLLLVSRGAESFARTQGLCCVNTEEMISPRALNEWSIWKARLHSLQVGTVPEGNPSRSRSLRDLQDTVGAVVWDSNGDLAAGVSSGGLLLKRPGRVGEAAIFGAGCWAHQLSAHGLALSIKGVTCSVSGTGEYIMRSMLAKAVCGRLLSGNDDAHDVLRQALDEFHDICHDRGEEESHAGVLLLVKENGVQNSDATRTVPIPHSQFASELTAVLARLWCAFTTESMAVGYASSLDPQPKATILRKPPQVMSVGRRSIYITNLPLTAV